MEEGNIGTSDTLTIHNLLIGMGAYKIFHNKSYRIYQLKIIF